MGEPGVWPRSFEVDFGGEQFVDLAEQADYAFPIRCSDGSCRS
jgi:hypothetical protein